MKNAICILGILVLLGCSTAPKSAAVIGDQILNAVDRFKSNDDFVSYDYFRFIRLPQY